jgi:hypothetical protein
VVLEPAGYVEVARVPAFRVLRDNWFSAMTSTVYEPLFAQSTALDLLQSQMHV